MAVEAEQVREELNVIFHGPGLDAGTMDVRDLAPALLALSSLFQEANRVVNPTAPDVALQIQATDTGSVHINLLLALDVFTERFSSDFATALANLSAIVIGPATGLFAYLRRRRRHPELPEQPLQNGDVQVILPDGTTLIYPAAVMLIARNGVIRAEVSRALAPLESDDCDAVEFKQGPADGEAESLTIDRDDLPGFAVEPGDDDPTDESVAAMTLTVVSPAFDGKKWRVSDGGSSFWVSILDSGFQSRIDSGEKFAKGDFLRCQVRFKQYETDNGLRLEREVLQVIEHRERPRPPDPLPGFGPGGDEPQVVPRAAIRKPTGRPRGLPSGD